MDEFHFVTPKKYFDEVVSLGGECQVAHQLNRLGLRRESYPFDWIFSLDSAQLIAVLQNNFEEYLELQNLQEDKKKAGEHRYIIDTRYGMVHPHIFPLGISFEEAFADVKATVDRRVKRFKNLGKTGGETLFVRINMSEEDSIALHDVLCEKFGEKTSLLVLNHTRDFQICEVLCEKGLEICTVYDENEKFPGARWQGYDPHWDSVFSNVRLRNYRLDMDDNRLFIGFHQCEEQNGVKTRWTTNESIIHLEHFGNYDCCIKFHSDLRMPFIITDAHNNVILEQIIEQEQYEFKFHIDHNTRWIKITPSYTWRPCVYFKSKDSRELGVKILGVSLQHRELFESR